MIKYLLVTTTTRDGVTQRQLVNLDAIEKMHEVSTEYGPRTVVKFISEDPPIFVHENIDQIMDGIGHDYIAIPTTRRKRRSG